MNLRMLLIVVLLILPFQPAYGTETLKGEVRIPVTRYDDLVKTSLSPDKQARPAPAGYALGLADISIEVDEDGTRAMAEVNVNLNIRVFENEWVLIPILPSGTPVSQVTVASKPVELISTAGGLSWGVNNAGVYLMRLQYKVDAIHPQKGYSLSIPVPQASANNLAAYLPGTQLDTAIIPSAGLKSSVTGNRTQIRATVPTTSGILISWRDAAVETPLISRARYVGKLGKNAVDLTGTFEVSLFDNADTSLSLLPQGVTLSDIRVDGKKSPILTQDNHFATNVKGKGPHSIQVDFQVAVALQNGPPRIDLNILPVPVSFIQLSLPGKKEVAIVPAAEVRSVIRGNETLAEAYIPVSSSVRINWTEAVPEEIKTELHANANIYHFIHAEEGILMARAMLDYQVTRGETNQISLELPPNIQINRITAQENIIADWRVAPPRDKEPAILNIFLDRQLKGPLKIEIFYDRSLVGEKNSERIEVPLMRARDVQRQRGMVALLASRELTLKPIENKDMTRVGENQLPAFVKQSLNMTVAHTFKYVEKEPRLIVAATTPERKQGKFDAEINTLISLGDVTMTGSSSIDINIKSGTMMDMQLALPKEVNFLSLTAPSLRTYKHQDLKENQLIDVFFTQEMEGQFRIDIRYERIMADGASEVKVPTASVIGAEVEQGRIAVEALTAVEVKPSHVEQLSTLDPGELPKQLILKTTNPILLAYKYNHVDPPYQLGLTITRHKELEVQSATIDQADYHTLLTRDGLAITAAHFIVRNSRKQFLRVRLPRKSTVWSAFVDGKPEKPALSETEDQQSGGGPNVLIKIINSAQGFPVRLTYQTPIDKIKNSGTIHGTLPHPDMVVTRTFWDVFLPEGLILGEPESNMKLTSRGRPANPEMLRQKMAPAGKAEGGISDMEALQFSIPQSGVHYRFEKLYANQSDEEAFFDFPYRTEPRRYLPFLMITLTAVVWWLGIGCFFERKNNKTDILAVFLLLCGTYGFTFTVSALGATALPAAVVSVIFGAYFLKKWRTVR